MGMNGAELTSEPCVLLSLGMLPASQGSTFAHYRPKTSYSVMSQKPRLPLRGSRSRHLHPAGKTPFAGPALRVTDVFADPADISA